MKISRVDAITICKGLGFTSPKSWSNRKLESKLRGLLSEGGLHLSEIDVEDGRERVVRYLHVEEPNRFLSITQHLNLNDWLNVVGVIELQNGFDETNLYRAVEFKRDTAFSLPMFGRLAIKKI